MPKSNEPKFAVDLTPEFVDTDIARAFLENQRWPDGKAICPHCEDKKRCYRIVGKEGSKTREGLWKCGACRKQFTVTVNTIFADTHIPLNKWLFAIHLLCSSKQGMSAHQMHRMVDVTYKSAWFMMHRIRYSMKQEPLSSKLARTAEIDGCYTGLNEKGFYGRVGAASKKVPVVASAERKDGGKIRSAAFADQRVAADKSPGRAPFQC